MGTLLKALRSLLDLALESQSCHLSVGLTRVGNRGELVELQELADAHDQRAGQPSKMKGVEEVDTLAATCGGC